MRQNTAVVGITCFIEASSVALSEGERMKMGEKKTLKSLCELEKERTKPWEDAGM